MAQDMLSRCFRVDFALAWRKGFGFMSRYTLETIIVILLILWLLGGFIVPVGGNLIHLLLVVILVVVVVRLLQGQRALP